MRALQAVGKAPVDSISARAAVVRFSFVADAIVAISIAAEAVHRRRDVVTKERRAPDIKGPSVAGSYTPSAIAGTALEIGA
jgi:hypothetical protein